MAYNVSRILEVVPVIKKVLTEQPELQRAATGHLAKTVAKQVGDTGLVYASLKYGDGRYWERHTNPVDRTVSRALIACASNFVQTHAPAQQEEPDCVTAADPNLVTQHTITDYSDTLVLFAKKIADQQRELRVQIGEANRENAELKQQLETVTRELEAQVDRYNKLVEAMKEDEEKATGAEHKTVVRSTHINSMASGLNYWQIDINPLDMPMESFVGLQGKQVKVVVC